MPDMQDLFGPQMDMLLGELNRRAVQARINRAYYDGCVVGATGYGIPSAIRELKLKNSYGILMSMATDPWGSLVVDSVQDRLEVSGIKTGQRSMDDDLWEIWQANAMDAQSKLAHASCLLDGRAYATVWPDGDIPEIVLDNSESMVVAYRQGRHQPRHRIAALRRWCVGTDTDKQDYATLYTPNATYRFESNPSPPIGMPSMKAGGTTWTMREEPGDDGWPVANPWGVLPVVEINTNQQLRSGQFAYARGEFENCRGLIDRINLLTYLGMIVAVWMGFPLTYILGGEIKRRILTDDDGNPIMDEATGKAKSEALPPLDRRPDSVAQITGADVQIGQLAAADRKNLSVFAELQELAMLTKTPRHYFPNDGGLSNISADTIRADEGALNAKVEGIHQPFIGEGHEEVLRVAGLMRPEQLEVPPTAAMQWANRQSRSLAESADAATKLASINFPWQIIAAKYLNWTADEIAQAEGQVASSAIGQLMAAAAQPTNGQQQPSVTLPVGAG